MLFSQSSFNLEYFESELKSKDYLSTKKKFVKDISSKSFGFLQDIYSNNLDEIINLAEHLKSFENVLFLGTGGSSLGGKTLVSTKKIFFSKNVYLRVFLAGESFKEVKRALSQVVFEYSPKSRFLTLFLILSQKFETYLILTRTSR